MSAFDYDALAQAGIEKVVIEYSGHGDEGFIDNISATPNDFGSEDPLYGITEDQAYDLLEAEYGGWEINEGSSGEITIDVQARKCFISHGWVIESVEHEDKEIA